VTVVVGSGGNGGAGGSGDGYTATAGTYGSNGSVTISWTSPPTPTCSVTFNQNPIAYGSGTTLNYTSSNATTFYITNVGNVGASGSTWVAPLATTNYGGSVSGPGGSATCPATLTVNSPASCTFNGSTVNSGSSVTAYQSSSVPYGQSCASQTRTCSNGSLSGSYQYGSCSVGAPASCTFNGQTIADSQSVTAYQSSGVPYGQSCASQTRTCSNGSLSGSYQYSSCSVGAPASCNVPWGGSISSGQSITAYQSTSVPYGSSCTSQTRSCSNGSLSGSYQYQSCSVQAPASCSLPWGGTIGNGQSVTAYDSSSEPSYGSCNPQTRTCSNGSLSGSYQYSSCTVQGQPSCSVTFDQNPIPYGSGTTLHWTSSNADWMYIYNVGYVGASGSTWIAPSATTNYTGDAGEEDTDQTCPATLTVNPPPAPTTTITADSSAIYVGQSTGIHATFAAGSGDVLTADNIDSPVGTGLGATTNPDASKSITFTPSAPGTYTFYARATTQYYTSWTTYNSVTVNVTAAPSCAVSLNPSSIMQGQSSTLSWSSSNASAFSIDHVGSLTPDTPGLASVSPSQSTDYTGTASVGGVSSNTCPATLTVSCTPTYACSGNTIQYTNSSCNVTNVTTCVSPQFCSSGLSVCSNPQPNFNPSGNYTGHLQALPNLVPYGNTITVNWNVNNVQSCQVTGTNGDGTAQSKDPISPGVWNSASGSKTSSPIVGQTTYTMTCQALSGVSPSSFTETQTVNIVPQFRER
jgi:hypothetical protein